MKTRAILITIGFLILSGAILSQEGQDVEKDFTLAIGLTGYQIRDQLVSNIRHDGNFVSLGLSHHKTQASALREAHFNFIFNPLTSRYESEIKSMGSNLAINYRYLKPIKAVNQDLQLFLGPVGGLNWHLAYYNFWDESHIYWATTYFAGINGRLSYQRPEKPTCYLDVYIPAAVLVSRPPERFLYKELNPKFGWIVSRLHEDMKLTSVHRHLELNATLGITFTHSMKLRMGLFWRFNYLKNDLPDSKEVGILAHTFGGQLIF